MFHCRLVVFHKLLGTTLSYGSQSTYTIFLTFSRLSLSSLGRDRGHSCSHLHLRVRVVCTADHPGLGSFLLTGLYCKLTLDLPLLLFVPWLAVRQHYHRL